MENEQITMNDVMGMVKVTNPQIYRAIIQRISRL